MSKQPISILRGPLAVIAALGALQSACVDTLRVSAWQGCADYRHVVVLDAPPGAERSPAQLALRLPRDLAEGDALRLDGTPGVSAEYREGGPPPTYDSRDVAGVVKVLEDDGATQLWAVKAIARNPRVDQRDVGTRGLVGKVTVRRLPLCR